MKSSGVLSPPLGLCTRMSLLAALLVVPYTAQAETAATANTAETAETSQEMRVGIRGGVSTFLNSQSYRPAHFIKPTTRVEFGLALDDNREVGAEIIGTQSDNENYSLLGALAFARAEMYRGPSFRLNLRGGFGFGSGPKILFKDLSYAKTVVPWGQFGLDMSWELIPGLRAGTALAYENLSTLSLLLTLDFKV